MIRLFGTEDVDKWMSDDDDLCNKYKDITIQEHLRVQPSGEFFQPGQWNVMPFQYAEQWRNESGWHPPSQPKQFSQFFKRALEDIQVYPVGCIGGERCYEFLLRC